MTKNLFITAVGGDIACSILRCICDSYHYDKIIGCDITKYVQGAMYIDDLLIAPKYVDTDEYIKFIKMICINNNITHFIPTTEAEIRIANNIRGFFDDNNIKLMINNKMIIEIATSKYKTFKYLNDNNVLTPDTYYIKDYEDQLGYPLIIKPDFGCGSKNIYMVNSKLEYDHVKAIGSDSLVVQQYIGSSDEEYTVAVFSDGKDTKSIAFNRKLGFGGMSVFVETIEDKLITSIAEKIAEVFDLRGSINIQMRKENGRFYVFEINPRLSSTVGFRHRLGFKDLIWWLDMLDGKQTEIDFEVKPGVKGIKTLDEMIFIED
ncbi:MAG: ATP-grasp domain-containing protein [Candidatus Phytoplasma sp.]|nr:ATP-grasp domain-containing protein [Phytoplasma sp.]